MKEFDWGTLFFYILGLATGFGVIVAIGRLN
jgi:hypothetical protein